VSLHDIRRRKCLQTQDFTFQSVQDELGPPPNAALDEEITRLLGAGKKIDAIKLLRRERTPKIGLAAAKAYVEAVEKGTDPEQAVAATTAPAKTTAWRGKPLSRLQVAVFLPLGLLAVGLLIYVLALNDVPRAPAQRSTVGSPVVAEKTAAQRTAATESIRAAVNVMVKRGLVKRMDVRTGKVYIYGDLWEVFELNEKEQIVKTISEYRDAEQGLPQVTLYESRSGKELASYGAFSGVTIR